MDGLLWLLALVIVWIPLALLITYVFNGTPRGVRREPSRPRRSSRIYR
jgi:hypothetical protein